MIGLMLNSWTLGGVAAVGVMVTGRRNKAGWLILVVVQVMWILYGVLRRDPGFMFWGTVFATLNGHNYLIWRRADRAALEQASA